MSTKPIVAPGTGTTSSGERPPTVVNESKAASEPGNEPIRRDGTGFDVIVTVIRQLPMASLRGRETDIR